MDVPYRENAREYNNFPAYHISTTLKDNLMTGNSEPHAINAKKNKKKGIRGPRKKRKKKKKKKFLARSSRGEKGRVDAPLHMWKGLFLSLLLSFNCTTYPCLTIVVCVDPHSQSKEVVLVIDKRNRKQRLRKETEIKTNTTKCPKKFRKKRRQSN